MFSRAFSDVVGLEGVYSHDPKDPGGETKFGITIATARAAGYLGPMKDMPLTEARRIYKAAFWDFMELDAIDAMSQKIAAELFECAVNNGPAIAGMFLQRALNKLNNGGKFYPDLKDTDGVIGPLTIAAFIAFVRARGKNGELVMLLALNCQQGARYLASRNERFIFGWMLKRVNLLVD